jgi:hypothetical protein
MTDEDKKIVADYMWWAQYKYPSYYLNTKGDIESHHFDLNDAGLVVQEMQKRGEWEDFHDYVDNIDMMSKASFSYVTAWLMSMEEGQAKNFFKAFVEWRKTK